MPVSGVAVRAEHVVFAHDGRIAISASSFDIPRGNITAVIGPNGSGKSTLLDGIAGLLSPSSGTLVVSPADQLRIAYVLQTRKVNETLPVTVREVVTMGRYAAKGAYGWLRAADRETIDRSLDRMAISDLADRHLNELSGGQRQRVFVAQGLAQDHDMLLLDEPMTGLDITSAQAIDSVIHDEHAHGCTVVMSTHDLSEARAADHVVLLAGQVVASGPPEEVLTADHLAGAYGGLSVHGDGDGLAIDDPAHQPVEERHVHRDRTIHTEPFPDDRHGGD
ncbi:MAG: zinc ABC transporter ATP-binding protein AztA [Acidimicrobiia bacterium]|nr:MAG: zinc ABC transporter ATP-binding protein AztA [Acidimicrobiia bacterium]